MSGRPASRRTRFAAATGPAKVIRLPVSRIVRRRRAIKTGVGVLVVSLMSAAIAQVYILRNPPMSLDEIAQSSELEAKILSGVNAQRARAGRTALNVSARLANVARGHSYDMALRHYLSHQSPEGIGPAQRIAGAGISCRAAGETVYSASFSDPSDFAARAVEAWLRNPEYRATILSDRYAHTGVGVARSAGGAMYITQDFVR